MDYSEALYKIDKFMPEDSDLQDEFYEIDDVKEMEDFIDTHCVDEERMHSYFPEDGTVKGFAEHIIKTRANV